MGPNTNRRARRLPAMLALGVALLASCSGDATDFGVLGAGEKAPTGITVTSTAFDPGEAVPERFSCEGENVPPPLSWKGVPAGTTELAVVLEDPDAPDGIFVHWLVVGIDAAATGLSSTGLPPGAEVLAGSSDNPTYIGPCPPDGDGDHRYVFEVYALRRRPALADAAGPVDEVRGIRKAAEAGGFLLGTFAR